LNDLNLNEGISLEFRKEADVLVLQGRKNGINEVYVDLNGNGKSVDKIVPDFVANSTLILSSRLGKVATKFVYGPVYEQEVDKVIAKQFKFKKYTDFERGKDCLRLMGINIRSSVK
jgi:hypothetical protein